MLIEPSELKSNDIVTLKLVGGDEVVGKLVDYTNINVIKLNKPLLVMMAQQGFGLLPYILTANPEHIVSINFGHIITMTKTLDAVSKEYIKQTTGLVV